MSKTGLCILQGRNWFVSGKAQFANGCQEQTLQSQAHQQQMLHQALAHSQAHVLHLQGQQQPAQKLKLDVALSYLDQVKVKLSGQPVIYNKFLDLMKEFRSHSVNIPGVIQRVSGLFKDHPDLLAGFRTFLPPGFKIEIYANNQNSSVSRGLSPGLPYGTHSVTSTTTHNSASNVPEGSLPLGNQVGNSNPVLSTKSSEESQFASVASGEKLRQSLLCKRPLYSEIPHCPKKIKLSRREDPSLAQVGKFGTLNEFAFFDKVRKALRFQEVYENFLRCLMMYNQEIISRVELIQLVTPFLGKSPELYKWFKDFLKYDESGNNLEIIPCKVTSQEQKKISGDVAMEIDYSSCRRYGVSYRALPKNYLHPKCSGRTALCKEVLNDIWVSFPSWSEDSTFGSTCKTQFEEIIYRCEDERFELDIVIEANLCTIRVLEGVQKTMAKMTPEERANFHLDDTLGGTSTVIHQRAITRIYGDKAADIIEGLKKNPIVAVPLVLRRLKAKEEEWREAQKNYNQIWREQIEKYYLKSLDHQGVSFKQNDVKFLRSKSLLNEIETVYEERHEQMDEGSFEVQNGPHMTFVYKEKSVFADAADLIMHHVKKQPGIHKEDRQKIRDILYGFIPDFFSVPHDQLVEETEKEEDATSEEQITSTPTSENIELGTATNDSSTPPKTDVIDSDKRNVESTSENVQEEGEDGGGEEVHDNVNSADKNTEKNCQVKDSAVPLQEIKLEKSYSLFFINTTWYLFFRLHHILCERLSKMRAKGRILMAEKENEKKEVKEAEAKIDYYAVFLETVKKLLDGLMDCNQYEDYLRNIFGIDAYISFTLDRVLQNIMRQLQHIVSEESSVLCTEMYLQQKLKTSNGSISSPVHHTAVENLYKRQMEQKLSDENCFRTVLYKKEGRMTIKLLDPEPEAVEDPAEVEKWSNYVDKYVGGEESVNEDIGEHLTETKVFLARNVHKGKQQIQGAVCTWENDFEKPHEERSECEKSMCLDESLIKNNTITDEVKNTENPVICTEDKDTKHLEITSEVKKDRENSETSGIITSNCDNHEDVQSYGNRVPGPDSSHSPSLKDDYPLVTDDNTQCRFIGNSYKMSFVVFTGSSLFKYNSLARARQFHHKVSERMSRKFALWHNLWLEKHVTPGMLKTCQDWLMKSDNSKYRVLCISENCPTKPPYAPYSRYKICQKKM